MNTEKNVLKTMEVRNQAVKVESLLYAADKMVEEFEVTKETKEELERFLSLFYMAVDAAVELKDMVEGL